MNHIQHGSVRGHGGARPLKMQFHLAAVGALERGGQVALEGQSAPLAPRRTQRPERRGAWVAERPVTVSARDAARRIDRVEESTEHRRTLAPGGDAQASGTSSVALAPSTANSTR